MNMKNETYYKLIEDSLQRIGSYIIGSGEKEDEYVKKQKEFIEKCYSEISKNNKIEKDENNGK